MTTVLQTKSERIGVHTSAPVRQLLQAAASVAQKNVSEFLLEDVHKLAASEPTVPRPTSDEPQ